MIPIDICGFVQIVPYTIIFIMCRAHSRGSYDPSLLYDSMTFDPIAYIHLSGSYRITYLDFVFMVLV